MQFAFEKTDWKPWAHANAKGKTTLATVGWRPRGPQAAHRACRDPDTGHVSFAHVLMTAKGHLRGCNINLAARSTELPFCYPSRQPTMTTLKAYLFSQKEVNPQSTSANLSITSPWPKEADPRSLLRYEYELEVHPCSDEMHTGLHRKEHRQQAKVSYYSLCGALLRLHVEYRVQFWIPWYKRVIGKLG